jgi:hypothetical protein
MKESCDAVTNVVVMIVKMTSDVITILKVPAGYVLLPEGVSSGRGFSVSSRQTKRTNHENEKRNHHRNRERIP